MAFCKYCGSKIASNEDFCEECKNDTDALFAAAKHFHSREIYKLSMKVKKSKDFWKEGLESLNKKDYTTAFFKFAAAANKDYSNAQLELGNLLFEGKGCTKNTSSAFYWYENAAKAGNSLALKRLKELSENGISQAKAIFEKYAKKQNNINQQETSSSKNIETKQDISQQMTPSKALEKKQEVVQKQSQNIQEISPKNLWKEGLKYLSGNGVSVNYKKAFALFQEAANLGYSNAQFELGNMLYEGKGCSRNTERAFYWYEKAGKAGNTDALKKLKELNRGSIQKQIIVSQQKASFKKVYAVQKETNLNIISELIKSMILSEPNPKDIYTIPYIQEYFLKFYKKDIENMITRDLLIKTCGELYAEENMYYFVESTTNSFLLCRAKNRADWREYGLGTVYIPTISVNDKKIDIRNFVLHVYDSLLNVKHNRTQHNVESVTIKALNAQGTIITFNAFYCHSCNEYYTTRENIILNRYPLIRFNFHSRQAYERREESELMMYGYTVKEGELSANQRQNLLARLITFGFLDKFYITGFIKYLINNNGRRANMKSAVEKWQSDLEFVQNFNIGTQRTVYVEDMKIKYRGSYVNKEILNNNYTSYQSKTIDDIMYERAKESGWEL